MIELINKSNKPKVSIGMPVYNGEKYIREALDSLLAQTFTDFELIISDNCSTDNTQEICREYATKDSRIRYARQSRNIRAISNFEFVLQESSSDFFMWAASDDIWAEDWLDSLYHLIIQTGAGAAFGQVLPINDKTELITHIATKMTYKFTGNRIFRRLKFYLEYEGAGKANLFYALFNKKNLEKLDLKAYQYDYSVIYDLLFDLEVESVKGVFFFKRDHAEAAGNLSENNKSILKKLLRSLMPVPIDLIKEYLSLAKNYEKLLIILFFPIKFVLAHIARIYTFMNK